jgi:hypothetical protein
MPSQSPVSDALGALEGRVVAVAPTSTELVGAVRVVRQRALSVTLVNDDVSARLNAWVQMGPTASGPWDDAEWSDLDDVAPGEVRVAVFDTVGRQWLRVLGATNGAGLSCRVWAYGVEDFQ